jgi:hypothetical protein
LEAKGFAEARKAHAAALEQQLGFADDRAQACEVSGLSERPQKDDLRLF